MIKDKSIHFFSLIQKFLQIHLKHRCSEKTIDRHKVVLNLFLNFLCEKESKNLQQLTLYDFTQENIEMFITKQKEEKHLAPSSCNVYLSSLKVFASFVMAEDQNFTCEAVKIKAIRKLKENKNLTVKFFSVNVLNALVKTQDKKTTKGFRNAFLMLLMFDTGCRLSEVTGLRLVDITIKEDHSFLTVLGKGSKKRVVPICSYTEKVLKKYLEKFHLDSNSSDFLFYSQHIGNKKARMSNHSVSWIVSISAKMARVKNPNVPEKITPHMFRHSRAMHLYRNGMSLAMVAQLLGHSQMETTQIYAYADTEMKRTAISQATNSLHSLFVVHKEMKDLEFKKRFGLT